MDGEGVISIRATGTDIREAREDIRRERRCDVGDKGKKDKDKDKGQKQKKKRQKEEEKKRKDKQATAPR